MFVLPAIDCYRTSELRITINHKALDRLLKTASGSLRDDQVADMKAAAVRGAKAHERMKASKGQDYYCRTVSNRYGPRGSVYRGLVIAKS